MTRVPPHSGNHFLPGGGKKYLFFDALNVKKGHIGLPLLKCLYHMYVY